MVKLVTEHGTFEAETEKEAMRLSRAARKEADRIKLEREGNSAIAYDRARINGYQILTHCMGGNHFPNGWRVKRPGSQWFKVERQPLIHGETVDTAQYEQSSGTAKLRHDGYEVAGIVWNGAGFDIMVFLTDKHTGQTEAYAVGVSGDQARLTELPGVTLSLFKPDNS